MFFNGNWLSQALEVTPCRTKMFQNAYEIRADYYDMAIKKWLAKLHNEH